MPVGGAQWQSLGTEGFEGEREANLDGIGERCAAADAAIADAREGESEKPLATAPVIPSVGTRTSVS